MKPGTLASVAAALLLNGVAATDGKCRHDVLYCGKTLRNMGWSTYNIWAWLEATYARPGRDDQYDNLLFQCSEHHLHDTLWYRVSCTKGCVDGGSGNNDYCR